MDAKVPPFIKVLVHKDQYLIHELIRYLDDTSIRHLRGASREIEMALSENHAVLHCLRKAHQKLNTPRIPTPTQYYFLHRNLSETILDKTKSTSEKYWFYKRRIESYISLHQAIEMLDKNFIRTLKQEPNYTMKLIHKVIRKIKEKAIVDPSIETTTEISAPEIYTHKKLTTLLQHVLTDLQENSTNTSGQQTNYLPMYIKLYCHLSLKCLIEDLINLIDKHKNEQCTNND